MREKELASGAGAQYLYVPDPGRRSSAGGGPHCSPESEAPQGLKGPLASRSQASKSKSPRSPHLGSCVALGKYLNPSDPQSPQQ